MILKMMCDDENMHVRCWTRKHILIRALHLAKETQWRERRHERTCVHVAGGDCVFEIIRKRLEQQKPHSFTVPALSPVTALGRKFAPMHASLAVHTV